MTLYGENFNSFHQVEIFTIIWGVSFQDKNYFLKKWNFLFSYRDETKVTIIWRKLMFHPGMKISTPGQLVRMKY